MTINFNISRTFIVIALIAITGIIWISIPTCRGVKKQAAAVDSAMIIRYKADTAWLGMNIRLTETIAAFEKHRADSLQKLYDAAKPQLNAQAKTISNLTGRVKILQSSTDTSAYRAAVDSLVDEVNLGVELVNQYRDLTDSLTTRLWNTIRADSVIKNSLHEENVLCNNFAFKLQLDVQRLREDSAVLSNKLMKSKKVSRVAVLVAALEAAILVLQK